MPDQDVGQRVLLVAPTTKDADITRSLLGQAGLTCVICRNLHELAIEIKVGAGAILMTEDAIADGVEELLTALARQPAWSDLPVVVLMRGGVQSPVATQVLRSLRNATLLERPAPIRSVVSAVQAAVRARQRQYQIRDQIKQLHLAAQERSMLLANEKASRIEADRANHMKDEFLATLSHELRTPLNAILGWAQLLQKAAGDPEMLAEGLLVIERNARVQTQLIEDLLDMSRVISGKLRLDMQQVDLSSVIHAALDAVRPSADAKGLDLREYLQPPETTITGDPARLQQVIWNLLSNAVKFTPRRGTIEIRADRHGSDVRITVTDSGDGIDPNFLPHVFERFRQANSASTRTYGGLGLGLSIVKHLVEMHGGTVTAQSAGKSRGATFIVSLPVRPGGQVSDNTSAKLNSGKARAETQPSLRLQGVRVLVVDDEPDTRQVIQRLLEEYQADVVTAGSSADALRALEKVTPDVIVSDIAMPQQDGYEFLRLARERGIKAPAVALTAFARPEDRLRTRSAGFQLHLSKPVEASELVAAVARTAGRLANEPELNRTPSESSCP